MAKVFTYDLLHRNGRLGNQLWQIASTMGLAAQADGIARFKSWEYRRFFSVPDEYFQRLPGGCEKVDGEADYLQELHYFESIQSDIRQFFKPSERIREELARRTAEIFGDSAHQTSLHVRRGDYLKYPDLFPLCSPEYYERALQAAETKHPDHKVIVFSDDIAWCKKHFQGRGFTFMHGVTRPVEVHQRRGEPADFWDVFIMTQCDQHIISNSSFSWWGAWLSENESPMYPSLWYGPGYADIPWRRMIPDAWSEIQC